MEAMICQRIFHEKKLTVNYIISDFLDIIFFLPQHILRLWNELQGYLNHRIEVVCKIEIIAIYLMEN